MQGHYDKVKEITEKGIAYNIEHNTSFLLHSLYYFYGLYFKHSGDMDKALFYCRRAVFQLEVKGDTDMLKHYKKILDKDFGFDFNGYLGDYRI
jgi:hypothetical protein